MKTHEDWIRPSNIDQKDGLLRTPWSLHIWRAEVPLRAMSGLQPGAVIAALFLLCLCGLIACGNPAIQPVDIVPEDMCSRCKMAISEKRCAAEFIEKDGTVFKFDDVACMGNYLRERGSKEKVEAYFVADYEGGGWIKAQEASFVRSPRIQTPMGGGIVAFKDRTKADAAAVKYAGLVTNFNEVIP